MKEEEKDIKGNGSVQRYCKGLHDFSTHLTPPWQNEVLYPRDDT